MRVIFSGGREMDDQCACETW